MIIGDGFLLFILTISQEFDPDIKGWSPDAETFVRSALPTLGWVQRTCGHWTHGFGVNIKMTQKYNIYFFAILIVIRWWHPLIRIMVPICQWWTQVPIHDTWFQRSFVKKMQHKAYKMALERDSGYNKQKWPNLCLWSRPRPWSMIVTKIETELNGKLIIRMKRMNPSLALMFWRRLHMRRHTFY